MVVIDFKFLVVVVKVPSECHRYAMRLVCSSCLEISLKTSVSEIQSLCFDLVKYFIKHISNTSPSTHEVRYPWKCLKCFLISLLVDYREIKLEKNFWKQFPYSQHDDENQRNKKGYTIRKVLTLMTSLICNSSWPFKARLWRNLVPGSHSPTRATSAEPTFPKLPYKTRRIVCTRNKKLARLEALAKTNFLWLLPSQLVNRSTCQGEIIRACTNNCASAFGMGKGVNFFFQTNAQVDSYRRVTLFSKYGQGLFDRCGGGVEVRQ